MIIVTHKERHYNPNRGDIVIRIRKCFSDDNVQGLQIYLDGLTEEDIEIKKY